MATKAIVGEKVGMTQIWDDQNRVVPVTVLQVAPCRVVQVKTPERDGYSALQVTFGQKNASKLTKPVAGQFTKAGVDPGPRLVELRLDDVSGYEVGQEISVDLLAEGDRIDVTAVSKGKGFAGVMKRHGFSGQKASHGAHRIHRAPGAIGACATPSRVFKGQRMAGRMGGEKVTTLNLLVVRADAERGLLLVKGAVPGPKGGLVLVRDAVKARGRCGLMATVDVLDAKGDEAGSAELDDAIFGIEPNVPVMHQVVTAQLAARRAGTQSTKTRAEVRGGGAKPWRQKGTGRARQGSIRSPQWAGGGVALGPKPRSYAQRTPKKMVRLALRSALSDRAADGKVLVVDWGFDAPKTKRGGRRARPRSASRAGSLVVLQAEDDAVVEELPQPPARPHLRGPRAQRLRRARGRLGGLHRGHAARRALRSLRRGRARRADDA